MSKSADPDLRLIAFNLRPEFLERPLELNGLSFPDVWWDQFRRLQSECGSGDEAATTPRIRPLNAVIGALVPSLTTLPHDLSERSDSTTRRSRETDREPWLLTRHIEQSDPALVFDIVCEWLSQCYGARPSYADVRARIQREDLAWAPITCTVLEGSYGNGTVKLNNLAFKTLPVLLADYLIERQVQIPIGQEMRGLFRVSVQDGAELITWPPVYHQDHNGQAWGYSYYIHILIRTLVGHGQPRLHFRYGKRRWTSTPLRDGDNLWLASKPARNVYLHRVGEWLDTPPTPTFTRARIHRTFRDRACAVWCEPVAEIARRLDVRFPEAEPLISDPFRYLEADGTAGIFAAIVEASKKIHPVQPGLDLTTDYEITRILAAALGDEIVQCPAPRALPGAPRCNHPLASSSKDLRNLPVTQRLSGFAESVGRNAVIEIWWQTEAVRDLLVDSVFALLCRDRPDFDEAQELTVPAGRKKLKRKRLVEPWPGTAAEVAEIALPGGGCVRIVTRRLTDDLGGLLPEAPQGRSAKQEARDAYLQQETSERARYIASVLGDQVGSPTLALAELPNYHDVGKQRYQYSHRDPLAALRLGMALTGRTLQTIAFGKLDDPGAGADGMRPKGRRGKDTRREQCLSAARDGLRHLGYLPVPIGFTKGNRKLQEGVFAGFPQELLVAAVWLIRLNAKRGGGRVYLPVVVLTHTQQPWVYAWVADDKHPESSGIRPYHQALCDIACLHPGQVAPESGQRLHRDSAEHQAFQAKQFKRLRSFLERDLPRFHDGHTLVLTVAHNARGLWKDMQDTNLWSDRVPFADDSGKEPPSITQMQVPLRVVRLRTSEREETPRWYLDNPAKQSAQGIWQDTEAFRLFYNAASKPRTMAGKRLGSRVDPTEYTARASLLEILPTVLQPDDADPAAYAYAIDLWRRMGTLLTNDMLLLPLPLHLAKQMGEYAEVIGGGLFRDKDRREIDADTSDEDAQH